MGSRAKRNRQRRRRKAANPTPPEKGRQKRASEVDDGRTTWERLKDRMQMALLVIGLLIPVVMAPFATLVSLEQYAVARDASGWPQEWATVEAVAVNKKTTRSRTGTGAERTRSRSTRYLVMVDYAFYIEGGTYSGVDRVGSYSTRDRADAHAAEIDVGDRLGPFYYDPDDPARHTRKPGAIWGPLGFLVFAWVFFTGPATMIWGLIVDEPEIVPERVAILGGGFLLLQLFGLLTV